MELTDEVAAQVNELMVLARQYATARVRRFAVQHNHGSVLETPFNVERRVEKAERDLAEALGRALSGEKV